MVKIRPDSPCIGACTTLYTEICKGCGRHYMEVANWVGMDEKAKQEVWKRLESQGLVKSIGDKHD